MATAVATTKPPEANTAEIEKTLRLLFCDSDVVELRSMNPRNTTSGYYDDFGKLAADAVNINRTTGTVYVTLQHIKSELLARRANHAAQFRRARVNIERN